MKKLIVIGLAVGLALGLAQRSYAFGNVNTDFNFNNQKINDSSTKARDMSSRTSTSTSTSNSNNRTDNRKYDSSVRNDNDIASSFNTYDSRSFDNSVRDNRSYSDGSIKDSFNTTTTLTAESIDVSSGKQIGSHVQGDMINSVGGNLDARVGHDFRGVQFGGLGSAPVDTSITNTQIFGNATIGGGEKKE